MSGATRPSLPSLLVSLGCFCQDQLFLKHCCDEQRLHAHNWAPSLCPLATAAAAVEACASSGSMGQQPQPCVRSLWMLVFVRRHTAHRLARSACQRMPSKPSYSQPNRALLLSRNCTCMRPVLTWTHHNCPSRFPPVFPAAERGADRWDRDRAERAERAELLPVREPVRDPAARSRWRPDDKQEKWGRE